MIIPGRVWWVLAEIPRRKEPARIVQVGMSTRHIAVVGGGAAGFFAAIRAGEVARAGARVTTVVTIYEATAHPLAKVRVSGGGRCNVTHACFDPREFVAHYPRGGRELLGPLHRFGASETVAWFAERGVILKAEPDGRMFPSTNDSRTVVQCLQRAAAEAGVGIELKCGVKALEAATGGRYRLDFTTGESTDADVVLLATGGGRASVGAEMARLLGHRIEPLVPSLFTFHIADARLRGLEGLAAVEAEVGLRGGRIRARGPALITHWGLSGPAILRLSAWEARTLHECGYDAEVVVNWAAPRTAEAAEDQIKAVRQTQPRKHLGSVNPFGLPARLWERLVAGAGLDPAAAWAGLSGAAATRLSAEP